MDYASYARRAAASLIDGVVMAIALTALFVLVKSGIGHTYLLSHGQADNNAISGAFIYVLVIIGLAIDLLLFVAIPKWLGATFGQFMTGIRLVMRDSTRASYNAIMLKHCMSFVLLGIAMRYFWVYALIPYEASQLETTQYIVIACYGWLFLNLFVMACNRRHHSLSDYIADTAVVDKSSVKAGYKYVYVDDTLSAIPIRPRDTDTGEDGKDSSTEKTDGKNADGAGDDGDAGADDAGATR